MGNSGKQGGNNKEAKSDAVVMDKCTGSGCKASAHRFNFCDEHYDQFKFGLIKKNGEAVSDYEKKLGHYQAYKQGAARKVA